MTADKPLIRLRHAEVTELDPAWTGVEKLTCRLANGDIVRALSYVDVCGGLRPGDAVVLNTAAVEAGLGTGGYAFVVARGGPDAEETPGTASAGEADSEWLVKARYTPLQALTKGVDEQGSEFHALLEQADSLAGMPVVTADLHSALPAIIAGIRAVEAPRPLRVAYVMTDGGALPLAFSRTVALLKEAGWLDDSITVGQAYGGDYEAVTVHTGLLCAHLVCRADIAIISQGPGNLGTDTRWGFSGVATGEAVNAVGILGGRAVGCLRMSQADPRVRHQGVSHHSITAYGRVAMMPADLVLPSLSGGLAHWEASARRQLEGIVQPQGIHALCDVDAGPLPSALEACPVALRTMGRSYEEDPLPFIAAAAAGYHAARLALKPAHGGE